MAYEKRSFSLKGHRTSVALEPEFWAVFDAFVARSGCSQASCIADIDEARDPAVNLASALRVFLLKWVQDT